MASNLEPNREVKTFCRVCEPTCGVIAKVEDGRITKILSNPDHVLSQGHFCKKAMAAVDVTYDPDRVLYPMKRSGGPGEFVRITWDQAYSEIAEKLGAIRDEHGPAAFATYMGNPPYFSYATLIAINGLQTALDVKWRYGVNGEDANALFAATEYLYGKVFDFPKPDLWRTSFMLVVGANPIVSHGSVFVEPRLQMALKGIVVRGGRVVVVDPRENETAQQFEHLPISAGGDAWFLSALLRELIEQGFANKDFVAQHTRGFEALRSALSCCTPEWAEPLCGVPAQSIRDLAKAFGEAPSATVYGRTGTCTQRFGTLSTMLLQLLSIVTGNLDRAGGSSFGWAMIGDSAGKIGNVRSRTTGMSEIGGMLPSTSLISDIEQPGDGQIRALLLHAANPMLQSPTGGPLLSGALAKLDLLVSIDIYMNETNRLADFILPGATMWEREDFPFLGMMGMMLRPTVFATPAVIEKQGEAKEDWEILYELCRRLGFGGALADPGMREQAKAGTVTTPRDLLDMIIRSSKFGDGFGERPEGLTLDKVMQQPDGIVLMEELPVGIFDDVIGTPDKRIDLASPQILAELKRMQADRFFLDPAYPLRMHSMRELLTHNSWMHNARSLAKSGHAHGVRLHPADAARYGIVDGEEIRVTSAYGEVVAPARVSDKQSPGNVALPQGWEHNGGWQTANARGGINFNKLASADPKDADQLSASTNLNGIPVCIAPA